MTVFWLDREAVIQALRRAAERLLDAVPEVEGVYLFGSMAEGRAVPGSDADVLVVLSHAEARWFDRPLALPPVFDEVGVPVELFCYTREECARVPLAQQALASAIPLAVRSSTTPPS